MLIFWAGFLDMKEYELGKSKEKLGFIGSVSSNKASNRNTLEKMSSDAILSQISKERQKMSKSFNDSISSKKKSVKFEFKVVKKLKQIVDTSKTFDNFISSNKKTVNAICHSFLIKKDRHMNID